MTVKTLVSAPILRIFDGALARAFYIDWLGFKVDFEHRFEPGTPIYMQVQRDGIVLHLSEHVGDSTPGSTQYILVEGIDEIFADITSRPWRLYRPSIEEMPWGQRVFSVGDPFGNTLRFSEDL